MIAKRLPVGLFKDVVEAAASRGGYRSDRKASVLRHQSVKCRNAIGPTVSVGIDNNNPSAAKRDTRDGSRMRTPPSAHALRVGASDLPPGYDWFLLPTAVLPFEASRKDRDPGAGEIAGGLE